MSIPILVKMAKTNDQFDKSFLDVDVKELVKQLTIDEKVSLLAGAGWWETVPVPRKNIPRYASLATLLSLPISVMSGGPKLTLTVSR